MNRYINIIEKEKIMGLTPKMFEMVQRPENYLNIVKQKLLNFQNNNIFSNINDLIASLNSFFMNEKIKFKLSNTEIKKYDSGLVKGAYNPKTDEIYLYYDIHILNAFKIKNIEYDKDNMEWFLEDFENFLGHEIIHRMQSLKDKVKNVRFMLDDDRKKYFSQSKEIMAHAWQIVQTFKLNGKDNDFIKFVLKKNRDMKNIKIINYIPMFAEYYNLFDKDSNVMKLLYKYIYQYIDD